MARPTGRARASFGQRRLWFLQQLDPRSTAYHLHTARRIKGPLSVDALERALNVVIRRQEALRTTFEVDGNEPVQVIATFAPRRLHVVDMSSVLPAEQWEEIRRWSTAEAERPFDLVRGPLFRPSLIRVSAEEHILLCVMHHIVADGWSLQRVLFRELTIGYAAILDGSAPEPLLPDLPIQYADFAEWQHDQVDATQSQLDYWTRELKGLMPLDLPTERSRPATPSLHVRRLRFSLPRALGLALEELSRREGVTLFMTLLAAFQVLLHRYAGQTDVAVGCPIAERNRAELEPIIGFLVNTVVIRGRFERDPTFLQHLGHVRGRVIDALDNNDVPFDRLVGVLAPERDPDRHPLVQVLFQLQERLTTVNAIAGASIEPVPVVEPSASGFDLLLNMSRGKEGIDGALLCATDLFDEVAAVRLSGHYVHLLHDIAADPRQRVSELSVADAAETRHLVIDLDNRQPGIYPDRTLPGLFEAQVDRQADAVAVTFDATAVTYRALDERGNQIAHGLRRMGAGAPHCVAVLLVAGPEQVATLFGVLKAAATFVCLDPRYPTQRLAHILEEARPDLVLADAASLHAHAALIDVARGGVVVLDLDPDAVAGAGLPGSCTGAASFAASPTTRLGPVDPVLSAFVVYTSGSTGRPKGIIQSHRSFSQFVQCQAKAFSLTISTRFAQWASCGYDASYCEIFGALCAGATLCMADPAVRFDPAALAAWVRSARISHLQMVPSFGRQFLHALSASAADRHPVPSLEHVFLAGEVLAVDLVQAWLRRFPGGPRLYNLYGPSETVLATCYPITSVSDEQLAIAVGSALEGRQVLILDPRGNLCPIGVDGEIHVRSPFLADGYLTRPAETAQAFVPDPLSRDGQRLYRTGDRGRWRDGSLHFLGRHDHQVKLRGNRVELGDVEATLARCWGVREAAVAVHSYGPDDPRLVAYVAFDERQDAAPTAAVDPPALDRRYVDECRTLYDEIYSLSSAYSPVDGLINTRSWTSSYTNRPLPEDDVRDSIDDAAERILALAPARVLEIGAGTGLLTRRLAPSCTTYCATDISEVSVAFLRNEFLDLASRPANFSVLQRAAHELDDFAERSFDAVVLNLVTQHFPDRAYLERVMQAAVRLTSPGGCIFVGGVRHLSLLAACHASVQFTQVDDAMTHEQFRDRAEARLAAEKDLAIAPTFFSRFLETSGRPGHVRVLPKSGRAPNEITRFQYDAMLHLDRPDVVCADVAWQDWTSSALTLPRLRLQLLLEMPECIAFAGVPNARLREPLAVNRWMREPASSPTVAAMREALRTLPRDAAVDPADLWKLGHDLSYDVEVLWTRGHADGALDVVFHRATRGGPPVFHRCPASEPSEAAVYTNQPLDAFAAVLRLGSITAWVRKHLPEHMVPSDIVVVDRLPRTANGKLDRKALAKPARRRVDDPATVAAHTPVEKKLLEVFREVVQLDRAGIHDNFFDLGGHSLLATQVMNWVRALFGVEIPLRRFLESPTVADLGRLVSDAQGASAGGGHDDPAMPVRAPEEVTWIA